MVGERAEINRPRSLFLVGGGFLGGEIGAGCLMDSGGAFVFLADFLDQATSDQILEFLIGAQAEHFLSTADGVAQFQIRKDALKQVVESKHFLLGQDVHQFVGYVIGETTGEAGTFRGNCHNAAMLHAFVTKATQKMGFDRLLKIKFVNS